MGRFSHAIKRYHWEASLLSVQRPKCWRQKCTLCLWIETQRHSRTFTTFQPHLICTLIRLTVCWTTQAKTQRNIMEPFTLINLTH